MTNLKTTEAQRRASKNYKERNPEQTKINRYRSNARTFVRHHATKDDIDDLIDIFKRENPNGEKMKGGMQNK
jgi:hypothetical protein|nr:MAG TPA: hypothetical protein [Caudoviricetes sp.]